MVQPRNNLFILDLEAFKCDLIILTVYTSCAPQFRNSINCTLAPNSSSIFQF